MQRVVANYRHVSIGTSSSTGKRFDGGSNCSTPSFRLALSLLRSTLELAQSIHLDHISDFEIVLALHHTVREALLRIKIKQISHAEQLSLHVPYLGDAAEIALLL